MVCDRGCGVSSLLTLLILIQGPATRASSAIYKGTKCPRDRECPWIRSRKETAEQGDGRRQAALNLVISAFGAIPLFSLVPRAFLSLALSSSCTEAQKHR